MSDFTKIKYTILTILCIIATLSSARTVYSVLKSSQRITDIESNISLLESKKRDLLALIEYKQADAYIEERARKDLNMAKEGEVLVLFKEAPSEVSGDSIPGQDTILGIRTEPETARSNFAGWIKLLFW
jgi:cell division protein FtsB